MKPKQAKRKPNPFDNIVIRHRELSPQENKERLERLSKKIIEAYVSLQLRKNSRNGISDELNITRDLEKELNL